MDRVYVCATCDCFLFQLDNAVGSTSGGNQKNGGCYSIRFMPVVLELHAQQSHLGVMFRCTYTFGHILLENNTWRDGNVGLRGL